MSQYAALSFDCRLTFSHVPFFSYLSPLQIDSAWRFSEPAYTAVNIVIGVSCLGALLCSALFRNTDPGYLKTAKEAANDAPPAAILPAPAADVSTAADPSFQVDTSRRTIIDAATGQKIEQRYCRFCAVWRAADVHHGHCHSCRVCVRGFDHHCGVLGGCVGAGNHRFFAGFLGFLFVAGGTALVLVIIRLVAIAGESASWRSWEVYVALLFAYGYTTAFISGFMFWGHMWMLCGAVTMKSMLGAERRQWQFSPASLVEKCCEPIVFARSERPEAWAEWRPIELPDAASVAVADHLAATLESSGAISHAPAGQTTATALTIGGGGGGEEDRGEEHDAFIQVDPRSPTRTNASSHVSAGAGEITNVGLL